MEPTASSANTLPPGSRLQNYRIVRLLGRGGFGVIYLAIDVSLGHRVAIKEYLPGDIAARADDSRVRPNHNDHAQLYHWGLDRFVKEARNLVRFRHPNIVRVSALFQENNTAYMVMDFEEGLSLRQYAAVPENRTESALKGLIKPIAQGLSEVHRQGFIHRDIKPGNILVRKDGSPVLLDFGSARMASRHATHGLTALVSSGYAPLEQYNPESEEQQGPWSDIYALGGVLYHCITQKDPADSTQRSLAIVNGQKDPLPSAAVSGQGAYSDAFLRAVDWALSVRIADRPQMLGDWIPALFATDLPPDASVTTQRLLDQQTRLASTPSDETRLEEQNWDKAMAAAEQRAAQDYSDTNARSAGVGSSTAPQRLLAGDAARNRHRFKVGGLLGLALIVSIAAAIWWGYEQLNARFESQQAAVNAQKIAAEEALAKAESARQEAISVVTQQRERDAEQQRLGTERQVAEREAERQRVEADEEASADKARQAEQARLANEKKAKEAAEAEAKKSRDDAENRRKQETLLDDVTSAIGRSDFTAARDAMQQARALGIPNPRIKVVADDLRAAVENAKVPISDSEFELIVGEFHQLKEAIERGDLARIERLTNGGDQFTLFKQLIDRFERLEMSITDIRARDADKSIVGTLTIERMIRSNGDRATPSPSYQNRTILSRREAGEWSDIIW